MSSACRTRSAERGAPPPARTPDRPAPSAPRSRASSRPSTRRRAAVRGRGRPHPPCRRSRQDRQTKPDPVHPSAQPATSVMFQLRSGGVRNGLAGERPYPSCGSAPGHLAPERDPRAAPRRNPARRGPRRPRRFPFAQVDEIFEDRRGARAGAPHNSVPTGSPRLAVTLVRARASSSSPWTSRRLRRERARRRRRRRRLRLRPRSRSSVHGPIRLGGPSCAGRWTALLSPLLLSFWNTTRTHVRMRTRRDPSSEGLATPRYGRPLQ